MTRPTTPAAAMAAALELDGLTPYTAAREAERLLVFLGDAGWMVAPKVSLPESAPSRGPRTSDTAAESISNLTERQWCVWYVLSYSGPFTDDELIQRYGGWASERLDFPKQSASSIRTRRKELQRAGHVVPTGKRRTTRAGGEAQEWAAVGTYADRVAA